MTPTARKALILGLGYGLLAMSNQNEMFNYDNEPIRHRKTIKQSTLTPQQKKKREKSKSARKARRKKK